MLNKKSLIFSISGCFMWLMLGHATAVLAHQDIELSMSGKIEPRCSIFDSSIGYGSTFDLTHVNESKIEFDLKCNGGFPLPSIRLHSANGGMKNPKSGAGNQILPYSIAVKIFSNYDAIETVLDAAFTSDELSSEVSEWFVVADTSTRKGMLTITVDPSSRANLPPGEYRDTLTVTIRSPSS